MHLNDFVKKNLICGMSWKASLSSLFLARIFWGLHSSSSEPSSEISKCAKYLAWAIEHMQSNKTTYKFIVTFSPIHHSYFRNDI